MRKLLLFRFKGELHLNAWHFQANAVRDNMVDKCSWLQCYFSLKNDTLKQYSLVFSICIHSQLKWWLKGVTPAFLLQLFNGYLQCNHAEYVIFALFYASIATHNLLYYCNFCSLIHFKYIQGEIYCSLFLCCQTSFLKSSSLKNSIWIISFKGCTNNPQRSVMCYLWAQRKRDKQGSSRVVGFF